MDKIWPKEYWPIRLKNIKSPPKRLFIRGQMPDLNHKFLCIVGSRKYSDYGQKVCESLIPRLAGLPVTIVSGLAYGIDSVAHKIALDNKINTVAFPGSGLGQDVIYPRAHFWLAQEILQSGGALISEYKENQSAHSYMFPERNRLMAGIADAVLIIEACEKSGTMITAYEALDSGCEVLAVPGSIFDQNSKGTNRLISKGAKICRNEFDIIESLGFEISAENNSAANTQQKALFLTEIEKEILQLIESPKSKDQIIQILNARGRVIPQIIEAFSLLEIKNLTQEIFGKLCQK